MLRKAGLAVRSSCSVAPAAAAPAAAAAAAMSLRCWNMKQMAEVSRTYTTIVETRWCRRAFTSSLLSSSAAAAALSPIPHTAALSLSSPFRCKQHRRHQDQPRRRWISSDRLRKTLKSQDEIRTELDDAPTKQDLIFGRTFTNHMLTMTWTAHDGWSEPQIVPYDDLRISPAASCLHYGMQCFEGMKAYRSLVDPDKIHLFRPDMNMKRLQNSMTRLHMTDSMAEAKAKGSDDEEPKPHEFFDHQQLIQCIGEYCRVEKDWIPSGEGYSLYLRPTVIATHRHLGLNPPDELLLYVIASPVGPYYKSGFKPIKLLADNQYVRAWPGGTGDAKVGGNYASTIKPAADASARGYSQILWLFGEDDEITEVGAMNVFFYIVNKDTGRKELITAPLWRGDILPGVTRASILDLARCGRLNGNAGEDDFDVSERFLTMGEVVDAAKDGRLLEAFGAGTAAVVTPVNGIHYKGQDIVIPTTTATTSGTESAETMTKRVWNELIGIQYRTKDAPPGWIVEL